MPSFGVVEENRFTRIFQKPPPPGTFSSVRRAFDCPYSAHGVRSCLVLLGPFKTESAQNPCSQAFEGVDRSGSLCIGRYSKFRSKQAGLSQDGDFLLGKGSTHRRCAHGKVWAMFSRVSSATHPHCLRNACLLGLDGFGF